MRIRELREGRKESQQKQQMLFMFKRLSKREKEKAVSYIEGMLGDE